MRGCRPQDLGLHTIGVEGAIDGHCRTEWSMGLVMGLIRQGVQTWGMHCLLAWPIHMPCVHSVHMPHVPGGCRRLMWHAISLPLMYSPLQSVRLAAAVKLEGREARALRHDL